MTIPIWSSLSDKTKYEVRSILHTFFAAAMVEWGATGFHFPDSKTALVGLATAALRSGVKAVSMLLFKPPDQA